MRMVRLRRSVLYLPGANERALEKVKTLPADVVIFDLEDAVAPSAKVDARKRACTAAASGGYGNREIAIRINGPETPWHDEDLFAVAEAAPDAVLVPKINSANEVHAVERALTSIGASERIAIWAMMETPMAMLRAQEIASASERLTVLVMGTNDLAYELRAEYVPGRGPLNGGLSLCLLAARAAGKEILDGVYNDIRDLEGFEAECAQGRSWGFDGKTLIHPEQIEVCNRVFTPSDEEIERSRQIIGVFEEARSAGRGVATVRGRMIENLHVENARRILALADAIASGA